MNIAIRIITVRQPTTKAVRSTRAQKDCQRCQDGKNGRNFFFEFLCPAQTGKVLVYETHSHSLRFFVFRLSHTSHATQKQPTTNISQLTNICLSHSAVSASILLPLYTLCRHLPGAGSPGDSSSPPVYSPAALLSQISRIREPCRQRYFCAASEEFTHKIDIRRKLFWMIYWNELTRSDAGKIPTRRPPAALLQQHSITPARPRRHPHRTPPAGWHGPRRCWSTGGNVGSAKTRLQFQLCLCFVGMLAAAHPKATRLGQRHRKASLLLAVMWVDRCARCSSRGFPAVWMDVAAWETFGFCSVSPTRSSQHPTPRREKCHQRGKKRRWRTASTQICS